MIIYKVLNKINGKVYIGQTTQNLKTRWSQHKYNSKNGNCKINRAIRKYGIENFEIQEIDNGNCIEELNKKEEFYIKKYDSVNYGYNIRSGGKNSIRSQETKNKISQSRIGKYKGKDSPWYGKKHTEKSKRKMSKSKKITLLGNKNKLGKTHTEEFKNKCKDRMKGNSYSKKRAVKCLNNNIVYESVVKASTELGLDNRSVHRVLKGEYSHTKGFKFEYT